MPSLDNSLTQIWSGTRITSACKSKAPLLIDDQARKGNKVFGFFRLIRLRRQCLARMQAISNILGFGQFAFWFDRSRDSAQNLYRRESNILGIWKTLIVPTALCLVAVSNTAFSQDFLNNDLVFATNQGLFERINGQTVPIPTAPTIGLYPSHSRDGRLLTFSRPDLGASGINPSSDLVVLDRVTGQQRVIVNHNTATAGGDFDPLSSQVSPSGQFVAYGVRIDSPFTFDNSSPTTELVIADVNTGLAISSPFADRISQVGPTSDALSSEFRGVSFFPQSDSFVTPVLDLIFAQGSSIPDPVTSIKRFDRNSAGQWFPAASLSTPTAVPTRYIAGIPVDAEINYQTFPAISPSGARLAYFNVFKPTRIGTGIIQPSTSQVVLANSDGTNPVVLTNFSPVILPDVGLTGFFPTGLTWTADESALLVSVSQQQKTFNGFLDSPNFDESEIYNVSTAAVGERRFVWELPGGFAPTLPVVAELLGGDYDADGFVGQSDLDLVLLNWGETSPPAPTGWVNQIPSGQIGQSALDGVLLNWGSGASLQLTAVPEPASALLFLVGVTVAILSRKRV